MPTPGPNMFGPARRTCAPGYLSMLRAERAVRAYERGQELQLFAHRLGVPSHDSGTERESGPGVYLLVHCRPLWAYILLALELPK